MYARVIRKVRRDSGEVVMDTSTTYHCVRATVYEAAAGGTECEIQLFGWQGENMKLKVVSNGKFFKVKVKLPLLPLWVDPGLPAYDTFEKAQAVVDRHNDEGYKDCQPKEKVKKL